MTLEELGAAWNGLRTAAYGRGTAPLVSRKLAERIGGEWDRFHAWYVTQGSLEDWFPSVTAAYWVERYRVLTAELKAEGKAAPEPLQGTWLEWLARTKAEAATAAKRAAGALLGPLELGFIVLVVGVPVALAVAIARGKR